MSRRWFQRLNSVCSQVGLKSVGKLMRGSVFRFSMARGCENAYTIGVNQDAL